MSATDHAFIRAYSQESRPATGSAFGLSPDELGVAASGTVDTGVQRVVISQMPDAGAPHIEPDGSTEAVASPHLETATRSSPGEPSVNIRIDGHDRVMPPPPHFDTRNVDAEEAANSLDQMTSYAQEAGSTATPQTPEPSRGPKIRPQWEVDRFRWPRVCDQLKETSSHRLLDVVKGLVAQSQRGDRVVGVTSYERCEGRTTLALCLAGLSAKENLDVALVDGDLDQPSLGQCLGVAFENGWNRMDDNLPLGEAAIVSLADQFVVFPAGQEASQFPEREVRLASGPLLATLSEIFDLVIVDVGPMYTAAHRWFLTDCEPIVPSALIVRDVRHTVMDQVDDVCCRLVDSGVRNLAIIENFKKAA